MRRGRYRIRRQNGRTVEVLYAGRRNAAGRFLLAGAVGHLSPIRKQADSKTA